MFASAPPPRSEPSSAERWAPGFEATALFAGPLLFVGEWRCTGLKQSWQREQARYAQLDVQITGVNVRRIGRERQVVDATVASVNAAGDEYRMASPTDDPQRCTFLLLRGSLADELAPRLDARFRAVSAAAALTHARLRRATDPVEIEETALALFRQIVTEGAAAKAAAASVSPERRVLAEEVQHVIATRFAERLTLSAIARACASSPAHVSRVFREVTGETVHRQLTRVRLRSAMLRLPDAGGSLARVALETGFSSHSHFTQAFRAEFGRPPSSQIARPGALPRPSKNTPWRPRAVGRPMRMHRPRPSRMARAIGWLRSWPETMLRPIFRERCGSESMGRAISLRASGR